ncbi:MAG: tRNA (adenosine(37)-N6)-threonylcarbamoyltransferase complex ATPase subunit type 1 TsaE [Planctomycetia bacterium]|nr:tRNA (adenosine(37)-N6)-threonylcarbamoyltransferase complex ATPase subunit type 1 TsaE [Planctomycetia bacterium]
MNFKGDVSMDLKDLETELARLLAGRWEEWQREKRIEFEVHSLSETDALGAVVERVLENGTVISLLGTLGAGKTRFVQAVSSAAGVPEDEVTSPTFVLIQEYVSGKRPIFHFDAYRLKDDDEFLELGPEEYFDGGGLTFIEWADRVESCLPRDYVQIRISQTGAESRLFEFRRLRK